MNQSQKQITKAQLKDEQRALKELKKMFETARKDVEYQISALSARKDLENVQSIIYQTKYQEVLLEQIDGVLEQLNSKQYETLQEFMDDSYENGYIGSMYDLMSQGVPLTVPINPKKMSTAIMTKSKLSKDYYQNRMLPENLTVLKRKIRQEITRGIAGGKTWNEVAWQVAQGMNSPFNKALSDAMRIVRTEGHRINQQGFLDAAETAVKKGADVVKQWDATLDANTRPEHQLADGQIKELDEFFIVGGEKMKAPGIGGSAKNVCNCRCQLLQRARWALDQGELDTLKARAEYFGLDKTKDFDEFKKKYLTLPKVNDIKSNADIQERIRQRREMYKNKHMSTPVPPKVDVTNKNGQEVTFNLYKNRNDGKFDKSIEMLKHLIGEYNTRLLNVEVGAVENGRMYAGFVTIDGSIMKLSSGDVDTTIHEFAHSLAMVKSEKVGLTHDKEFWKEIRAVKRKYRNDVGDDSLRWISSYEHSENNIDEFMAEAFTQAKLRELGLDIPDRYGHDFKYSQQVLDIIDKYFKKGK